MALLLQQQIHNHQSKPSLTAILRQFDQLSITDNGDDAAEADYSIFQKKRTFLVGSDAKNYRSISRDNLCGRLVAIIPSKFLSFYKKEVTSVFRQYSDSCVELVGKDTTDLLEFSASATLLIFGCLGPVLVSLVDSGVSPEDCWRHHKVTKLRPEILSRLGGVAANNIDDCWRKTCTRLASLLSHKVWCGVTDELLSLMQKCRLAAESDSNFLQDLAIGQGQQSFTRSQVNEEPSVINWQSEQNMCNSMNRTADILYNAIFGVGLSRTTSASDQKAGSLNESSAALAALRNALTEPLRQTTQTTSEETTDISSLVTMLSAKAEGLGIPVDQLVDVLFGFVDSTQSDDVIQNELLNLVGCEYIDLVFDLLRRRAQWIEAYRGRHDVKEAVTGEDPAKGAGSSQLSLVDRLLTDPAAVASARLAQQEANATATANRLREVVHLGPSTKTRAAEFLSSLPYVFDALAELRCTRGYVDSSKLQLPVGTTYQQLPMWDQVEFPIPSKPPASVLNVRRVKISSLDQIGQTVFSGLDELNLIQSVVYPVAYHTSENLLVAAPTGAGKTNVALLAIVQLLRSHLLPGNLLDLKAFKIVYLAPMKALAAEMAATFSARLAPFGVKVRECTGDMQLSKQEILETQMLVSTPEKWDVISRKGSGDATLVRLVKLLIIDEIHILHSDRGSVIEVLVARTLRQVETSQTVIRVVGLSATLPNYLDIASFIHVNPYRGLFFFDERFRPVPLKMSFLGVRGSNRRAQEVAMNTACYEQVLQQVKDGQQVMVFVHARGDTFRTARWLRDYARQEGKMQFFQLENSADYGAIMKKVDRSGDQVLRDLLPDGFACHHAGMLRHDRSLVERLFISGHVRVLLCTATLAWGVNLPAHAVVIKGTRIYKAEKSDFADLDILDVLQIFGRAGRPQYDSLGVASIITAKEKLDHYLRLITNQTPIESTLLSNINDHLNAEIALGTVASIDDAVTWLKETYFFIRLLKNPLHYGIQADLAERDPEHLVECLRRAAQASAMALDAAEMVRYDPTTGQLASTDRGRTASLYYIRYNTAAMVKDLLEPDMMFSQLFSLVTEASEFSAMKVREEEGSELVDLRSGVCHLPIKQKTGGSNVETDVAAKVNALLQGYISRHTPSTHSLVSDMNYIQQNAGRVVRYLFEISLRQGWSACSTSALKLARMIEQRLWDDRSPLWQFVEFGASTALLNRVDDLGLTVDKIRETGPEELTQLLHYRGREGAREVFRLASHLPRISTSVQTQPITRTILRVQLTLSPDFTWFDRVHGSQQCYWIWVEDPDQGYIYHSEYWTLTRRIFKSEEPVEVSFTIPLFEPFPTQYLVRVISDLWLDAEVTTPISFKRLILPPVDPPHTDLLNLTPLPVTALQRPDYELLYNFTHFNPIQTQIFHTLYHQDVNVLLGAPTGSGKTVAAELAIFRLFNTNPTKKCVYIAPLKALVRERIEDWSVRLGRKLGKRVVELTGDVAPDIGQLLRADLIVTTPEKWDGISRSWQQRAYVRHIALIVIDEIHLLGEERGPVLEVLVSRANYIASQLGQTVRLVGLSTALSNASDLAAWLRVPTTMTSIAEVATATGTGLGRLGRGLFNFRPSVRPVPLETHVQGYAGRHYCPRMATMNKPVFQAICSHSPKKPVLVFVSSRRQTRLTALDLVALVAPSGDSKRWLHIADDEIEVLASRVHDTNLRLTLSFGIGLHHAGLQARDRSLVEELFANQKIQILIATSTLAWGVNFPAHLVVIKGTEYYDGKTKRYIDYPITDVLQMMGRAGRPQFDDQGKAVIMVQDTKKVFYKRFLYEPFPVESCLLQVLPDHINAEVVAGTISDMQEALQYLTWTFFFRRLLANPSYYGLEDSDPQSISVFLSGIIHSACQELIAAYCMEPETDRPQGLEATPLGKLAAYYYLSYKTMQLFTDRLAESLSVHDLLEILSRAHEYSLLPVRHNEDEMNTQLEKLLPLKAIGPPDCPHTKTHLLLQAYFSRLAELPVADYITDTRSVLDQATRILQAMLDACAQCGWLTSCINCVLLMQMINQGVWIEDQGSSLLQLPGIEQRHLDMFRYLESNSLSYIDNLPELIEYVQNSPRKLFEMLQEANFQPELVKQLHSVIRAYPLIQMVVSVEGADPSLQPPSRSATRVVDFDSVGESCHRLGLFSETEYVLRIQLVQLNAALPGGMQAIRTSALVKSKRQAGWILLLGQVGANTSTGGEQLLAMKRVPPQQLVDRHRGQKERRPKRTVHFSFQLPRGLSGRHHLVLYLVSDTFLGLDQQLLLRVDVSSPPNDVVDIELQ